MVKFLVDVNLPKKFKFWSGEEYLHVADLDARWSDSKVWDFARANNLTILTKDSDFSDRIIASKPPPKVIHFKTGNMKIQEFHDFILRNWEEIKRTNATYKLVNVYVGKLTAIK